MHKIYSTSGILLFQLSLCVQYVNQNRDTVFTQPDASLSLYPFLSAALPVRNTGKQWDPLAKDHRGGECMPKRPTRYDLRCSRGPLHQQYSNNFTDAPSPGLGSNRCHSPAAFVGNTAAQSSELHSFLALMLSEPSRTGSLSPPSGLHAAMTLLNS